MRVNWFEQSKLDWWNDLDHAGQLPRECLQIACLQRIAASCETMALHNDQIIRERDYFKNRVDTLDEENKRLRHSAAALRGHLKKAKGHRE